MAGVAGGWFVLYSWDFGIASSLVFSIPAVMLLQHLRRCSGVEVTVRDGGFD